MADIYIGDSCTEDRAGDDVPDTTYIWAASPASADVTVENICARMDDGSTDFYAASFEFVAGTDFNCNGVSGDLGAAASGNNSWASPVEFTAWTAESGEYVGSYHTDGDGLERDADGGTPNGYWYISGTNECDNVEDGITFTGPTATARDGSVQLWGPEVVEAPTSTLLSPRLYGRCRRISTLNFG